MPNNSGICFKEIHEKSIYQNDSSKDQTLIIMINKFSLRNFFDDIGRKKQRYNQNNNIYYKNYPSRKVSHV